MTPDEVLEYLTTSGEPTVDPANNLSKPLVDLDNTFLQYFGDIAPPNPDPMEWEVQPAAVGLETIYMRAATAKDDSGVEYYFDCLTDDAFDKGWQDSPVYYQGGYAEGTTYQFRVKARDKSEGQNETAYSEIAETTTASGTDNLPPAPDPARWKAAPRKIGGSAANVSVGMEAYNALDEIGTGVEYRFEETSGNPGGGFMSVWQDSPVYIASGLSEVAPGYTYSFRVQVRDKSPNQNETAWSTQSADIDLFPPPRTLEVPYPYATIQGAINAANNGDTVIIHPGTYGNDPFEEDILIQNKTITIRSENPENPDIVAATIIDPSTNGRGGSDRAFIFDNSNAILEGLTIQNAESWDSQTPDPTPTDAFGGAIACLNGSNPTIRKCIIRNSVAVGSGANGDPGVPDNDPDLTAPGGKGANANPAGGGGIYADATSSPLIEDCIITGCSVVANGGNGGDAEVDFNPDSPTTGGVGGDGGDGANTFGGGVYFAAGSGGIISNCIITNNVAYQGAAGLGGGGETPGTDSTVNGVAFGGGISHGTGNTVAINSTQINNNSSDNWGGGLWCAASCTATLTDCQINGNQADTDGGGGLGFDAGSSATLTDCTISSNNAVSGYGGGIWFNWGGTLTLDDTDIIGNTAASTDAAGGGIFAGNTDNPLATTVVLQNDCLVSENESQFGGGISVVETNLTVEDSVISGNTAIYGGGAHWYNSIAVFHDCTIKDNIATGDISCSGAGLYCLNSSAVISDVVMTGNDADGFGGALYIAGPPLTGGNQDILNCLIVGNSAAYDGGGISSNLYAAPFVANCTIADNEVTDSFGSGGGVSCYDAFVEIIDSILWNNSAVFGPQLGIGDPLEFDNPFSTVMMSYTDIQGGEDNVFIGDGWGPWLIPSETNIDDDPLFAATDSLNNYYLSQIAAGQLVDSPCLDAGSITAAAAGLDTYTTRTDHIPDVDIVDMGYHYKSDPNNIRFYTLETEVYIADRFPHGKLEVTTDPNNIIEVIDSYTSHAIYRFKQGTVVQLRAVPAPNYRVARWFGADSDPFYYGEDNTVTMTGYQDVQVEFERGVPKELYVGDAGAGYTYNTIEDALAAARSGDTIILEARDPDRPHYIDSPDGLNFGFDLNGNPKNLTIRSTDPNDPDIVANTIIDCQGSRYLSKRAFHFDSGQDSSTRIEGITIKNAFTAVIGASAAIPTGRWPWWDGFAPWYIGSPVQPWTVDTNPPPFRAMSGEDATGDSYGGAVLCEKGSSPVFYKCVFEDCTVAGGIGGDGADGSPPPGLNITVDVDSQSGGHSGEGIGNGFGGAFAIRSGSNPTIEKCIFKNNRATGGWGGIPGDAGGAYGSGRYGWGGNDPAGLWYANENFGYNENAGRGEGDGRGGAIFVEAGCDPTIKACKFVGNYARPGFASPGGSQFGGATYQAPFDPETIGAWVRWGDPGARNGRHGQLTDHEVSAGGAIFYEEDADDELIDCEFIDGYAADIDIEGGTGFYSPFGINPFVELFSYTRGGAVFTGPNVVLGLNRCKFTGNLAGALYCTTGVSLTIDDSDFINNASYDPNDPTTAAMVRYALGGAITVELGAATASQITGCRFIGNQTHGASANLTHSDDAVIPYKPDIHGGGGAIHTDSDIKVWDSSFNGNRSLGNGGAFYTDFYTNPVPTTIQLDFTRCDFSGNQSLALGGAGYVRNTILNMNDCFFVQNKAFSGGGLYAVATDLALQGLLVYENEATGNVEGYQTVVDEGLGGGLAFVDCGTNEETMPKAAIVDSRILKNKAAGTKACGGGVCITGGQIYKTLNLLNCLIAGNESENTGGGLSVISNMSVQIDSCTIADNTIAEDTLADVLTGGILVDYTSDVSLQNSIVSGNRGYGIYEKLGGNGADTAASNADYTLFYGNTGADLFDAQSNGSYTGKSALQTQPQPGYTNIFDGNPLLTTGPLTVDALNGYYLTQTSPAVDASNIFAADAMLGDPYPYTTDPEDSMSRILDMGYLDLGYHYDDFLNVPKYTLTAQVQDGAGVMKVWENVDGQWQWIDFGSSPREYYRGQIVYLKAEITNNYFLTGWDGGTINDNSQEAENKILMTGPRDVQVLVRRRQTLTVGTSKDYDTLGEAIENAEDGDIILIAPGTYTSASGHPSMQNDIVLDGRILTITGTDPENESVVRNTIFRDFAFELSNLDKRSVIEGIHLNQSKMNLVDADLIIRNCVFSECRFFRINRVHAGPPAGTDGAHQRPIFGGAIEMYNSSPKITNCTFENNSVTSATGEDGFAGDASYPNGGDGGWPSRTYGGAVYCGLSSNAEFINCTFTGNEVFGGNGGNGADYVVIDGVPYLGGRGGGWVYDAGSEQDLISYGWDGWTYNNLFNDDKYSGNFVYGDYFGQYDFEDWVRWFNWGDSYASWDQFFADWMSNPINPHGDPYDQLLESWRYSGYGGAVYCEIESNATFKGCVFENNQSHGGLTGIGGAQDINTQANRVPWPDRRLNMPTAGGAVYAAFDSDLTFEDCLFRNNVANTSTVDQPHTFQVSYGGAVAFDYGCQVTFINCDIMENNATVGGGLYGLDSQVEVVDCNVFDNEAYIGAGIFLDDYLENAHSVITGTLFRANRAVTPSEVPGTPTDDDDGGTTDDPVVPRATLDLTGDGGGLYARANNLHVRDSIFVQNEADISGGGLLLIGMVEPVSVFNCLFAQNTAGVGGAGASVSWSDIVEFANCTFADNTALGIYDNVESGEFVPVLDEDGEPVLDEDNNPVLEPVTEFVQVNPGSGGGLSVSYNTIVDIVDSIFWGNSADQGESIYIGTSAEFGQPSTVNLSYAIVGNYPSANAIFTDDANLQNGSTFNPVGPVYNNNPDFVTPEDAEDNDVAQMYYLNQQTSAAIDAGSGFASDIGLPGRSLAEYTTSTKGALDTGIVDLGFHYEQALATSCRRADLVLNGIVDFEDLVEFASWWLSYCDEANMWCDGADQNFDTTVGFRDYANFANCWLAEDNDPPFPNPAQWESEPSAVAGTFNQIEMTAKLHNDLWFPNEYLEYYFDCVVPVNGPDSGWQSSREFTVTNLTPATYQYVVRVRDPRGNVTEDSVSVAITPGESTELPAGQWLEPPFVTGDQFAIQMEALAYGDYGTIDISVPALPSGYVAKYQFEYTGTAQGGDGRVYGLDPVYVDEGMVEGQTYSYRTRIGLFYEPGDGTSIKIKDGDWSEEASVIAVSPDLYPPLPNPAEHASGSPFEVFVASESRYYHVVTAVTATDVINAAGDTLAENENVEYKFVCSNSSFSSGSSFGDPDQIEWLNLDNVAGLAYPNGTAQVPEQYWANRGLQGRDESWYILVRDRTPNQNQAGPSESRTIFTPAPPAP